MRGNLFAMSPTRGQDQEAAVMLDEYFLPTGDLDEEALLSDWRWLIGNKPVSIHVE
jgi:hypothetical protein